MTEVNNSGALHHTQQQAPILDAGKLPGKERVSGGQLDGKDLTVSSRGAAPNEFINSKGEVAPQLETPGDTSLLDLESASVKIAEISKHAEESLKSTRALLSNIVSGKVTPEQTAQLQQHAAALLETSEYVDNLQGKGLDNTKGKESVLAALGFSDAQLEALLSLANPDDAGNSLASLHGGARSLNAKASVLRSLGFSDSQIDALLSMANPDDDGNSLASLHQSGAGAKELLKALGFQQQQIDKLIGLLNGTLDSSGFSEQAALLKKMGFTDAQAETILSNSDNLKLKEQKKLLESASSEQSNLLKSAAIGFNTLSANQVFGPEILEQLVDMFAVMELLHKMSVEQRQNARTSRSINYEASKQQVLVQAEKMKDAAVKTAIAGFVSAGAKMAAAAAQGGFAVKSAKGVTDGVRQAQVAIGNALGSSITSMGDIIKTGLDYTATMDQAEIKVREAIQKTYDNAAQSDSEFLNMHQDMIRNVQSKMDEIIRSWFETLKSTTRV
ncbi:hypothetical protein [uncultured Endozoicomonas sp.]|uniref:hypothetical protein n=1 Tax=uncultured Endozoicomonas sp. TaxID=432652 RepID=UPI00260785A1|nr:hypothetical protein [uncultured Endozoicomonas sp.]